MKAQKVYFLFNFGTRWERVVNTRHPFYGRLGGPQCRSERVRKISPPWQFDPRTIQPVASRYSDYDILYPFPYT